jgi:hypothetical protein
MENYMVNPKSLGNRKIKIGKNTNRSIHRRGYICFDEFFIRDPPNHCVTYANLCVKKQNKKKRMRLKKNAIDGKMCVTKDYVKKRDKYFL